MAFTLHGGPNPSPLDTLNKEAFSGIMPISPEVRKTPEAQSIVDTACTAVKGLVLACTISGAAAAMPPKEVSASTNDMGDILSMKNNSYGHALGWSDFKEDTIKLAGAGVKFDIPVKPEVKELWDFLAKNKREKDIDNYNALLPDHRKKTIEYFQAGKKEQKDERALLKGVVNYMSLSISLEKAYQGISEYSKTGKLPKELPTTFTDSMERALAAFPSAENFIDKATVVEIESQTKAIYQENTNEMNAKTLKTKQDIERIKKLIEALSK